jgi:hypothetical protein
MLCWIAQVQATPFQGSFETCLLHARTRVQWPAVVCSAERSAERQAVIADLRPLARIESCILYSRHWRVRRSSVTCARMRSLRAAKRNETRRAPDAAPIRKRLVARGTVKGMQASKMNSWIRRLAPSCARRGRTVTTCNMSGCDKRHKRGNFRVEKKCPGLVRN